MALFGGKYVGNFTTGSADGVLTRKFKVTNGTTITKGDFVYFASGLLTNASVATQKVVGCANETVVGTGSNTCEVIVNFDAMYVMANDNLVTTFGSTHPGTFFDLIGATGAQLIDTSTTSTTGTMVCLEYNPQISPYATDTTVGLFMIAENGLLSGIQ